MKVVTLALGVVLSQFAAFADGVSGSLFIDAEPSYNYTAGIVPDAAHTYPLAAGETLTSSGPASDIFLNAEETTKGHIIGYKLRELIGGEWQERAFVAGTSYTYTQSAATEARLIWVWAAEHQLTIDAVSGGTVSGATSGDFVPHGDSVTLTAAPADGYEFVGWVGEVESEANPVTFAMNGPKQVIPFFRALPVEVPDATEPVAYSWGWSNQVTIAKQVYSVLAFTTVGTATAVLPKDVTELDYLVVGGGGGGAGTCGGGGGAGGFIYKTAESVTGGGTLSITVGGGGAGGTQYGASGGKGGNSVLSGAGLNETAVGGGAGGRSGSGGAGGSGGGAGGGFVKSDYAASAATEGQGYPGGKSTAASSMKGGAGGGGAGGKGADSGFYSNAEAGLGGPGVKCAIVGTNVWYAAGGGGGTGNVTGQSGGSTIGGHGGGTENASTAGAANTGSGGGGGAGGSKNYLGAAGGSGIVILRYFDSTACVHEWVTDREVAPSCEAAGFCEEHCSKCNERRTRILPAAHRLVALPAVAPTVTTTGLEEGWRCSVCGHVEVEQVVVPKLCAGVVRAHEEKRPVRVLVVGHSQTEFLGGSSADGLNAVGHKLGEQVDVTALYKGGCSLDQHWYSRTRIGFYDKITSTSDSADYPLADAGSHRGDWSLEKALAAVDWDVVVLQNSPVGAATDTYGCLPNFVAYVRELAPNAQVYFHQTWSFDRYYTGGFDYDSFGHDIAKRDEMYDEIVRYSTAACSACGIELLPSGFAVQLYRYRKPVIADGEDIVSKDHVHLGGHGNYLVCWTWCRRLFGKIPTAAQYPAISDAALLLSCSYDAANSYDYLNYGKIDFSWQVNLKHPDGADDIQSVTNRATVVIPSWTTEGGHVEGWTKEGSSELISSATLAATPIVEDVVYTPKWVSGEVEPPVNPPDEPVEPPEEPVDPPLDPVDPTDPTDPTDPIIPKGNTNWITNVGFDGTDPKWGELPPGAAFKQNRLVMDIGDMAISYPGLIPVDVIKTNLTVHSTMAFPPYETLPAIDPNVKAGIAALATETETNYWVIAKVADGNANEWSDTGLRADTENEVPVRIVLTTTKGGTSATYQFGESAESVTRMIYTPSCAQGVLFTGNTSVSALEGWYNTPRKTNGVVLMIY